MTAPGNTPDERDDDAEVYRAALIMACIDGWADGAGAFEHYMERARLAVEASR